MIQIHLDADEDTQRAIAETIESMLSLLPHHYVVETRR